MGAGQAMTDVVRGTRGESRPNSTLPARRGKGSREAAQGTSKKDRPCEKRPRWKSQVQKNYLKNYMFTAKKAKTVQKGTKYRARLPSRTIPLLTGEHLIFCVSSYNLLCTRMYICVCIST